MSRCAAHCASSTSARGSPVCVAIRPRAGHRYRTSSGRAGAGRSIRSPSGPDLPYHPLWEKGYVSIGDHHSTKPLHEVATLQETRFSGLKRECGIHEIDLADL